MRRVVLPWGPTRKPPSDRIGAEVVQALMTPGGARERPTAGIHVPKDEREPLAVLEPALRALLQAGAIERRLRKLSREGKLTGLTERSRLAEARDAGTITAEEYLVASALAGSGGR